MNGITTVRGLALLSAGQNSSESSFITCCSLFKKIIKCLWAV